MNVCYNNDRKKRKGSVKMTQIERYEMVKKVERVRITYARGVKIEESQESKVYRVGTMYTPSGSKYKFLVWSKKAEKCVWVRIDDVEIIKMADTFIHTVN